MWTLRRKLSNVNLEEEFILSEMDMHSLWLNGPKFKIRVQRRFSDRDFLHTLYVEEPRAEPLCFLLYALTIYAAWVNQYREVLYSVTAMLSTNQQTVTCPDQSEWYKMCPYLHLHRSHPNYNLQTSFTWNWQVLGTTVGKFSIRNSLSFVLADALWVSTGGCNSSICKLLSE